MPLLRSPSPGTGDVIPSSTYLVQQLLHARRIYMRDTIIAMLAYFGTTMPLMFIDRHWLRVSVFVIATLGWWAASGYLFQRYWRAVRKYDFGYPGWKPSKEMLEGKGPINKDGETT